MNKAILYIIPVAIIMQTAVAEPTGRQLDIVGPVVRTIPFPPNANLEIREKAVIGQFWDDRCTSVSYTFNKSIAPNTRTPNALSTDPNVAVGIMQNGLDRWNSNPSSYIEMNVDNVVALGTTGRVKFDQVNEIIFQLPAGTNSGVLGTTRNTSIPEDVTFVAGDDFDLDGDADVFDPQTAGINVCTDIDLDGDIEFPAGLYKAGTILDSDIAFDENQFFSTEASDSPDADLDSVSLHEFGHSHGVSHSMINQISAREPGGSTMYWFIESTNGAQEQAIRSLHTDDLAASAYIYPEGQGTGENAQIQSGDIPFADAYALLKGNVTSADGTPILSAAVSAVNARGERVAQTYTGANTALYYDLTNIASNRLVQRLALSTSVTENSGRYVLPVPVGKLYTTNIEAVDGSPVSPSSVGQSAEIADTVSNVSFPEETSSIFESANEVLGAPARRVFASKRRAPRPLDFVLNEELQMANAGPLDFASSSQVNDATDLLYAAMFDRESILQALTNGRVFTGGVFNTPTLPGNESAIAGFNSATLALGTVDAETGNVEITEVIDADRDFIAQENELSPYEITRPAIASFILALKLVRNPDLQVFLTIEANNLVPIRGNKPNALIALSQDNLGTSFLSVDGGPLAPAFFGVDWDISLRSTDYEGSRIPSLIERLSKFY